MKGFLKKALNVEPEESNQVLLLLAMGFLIGIFLATYDVASIALFLSRFDEQKDLPVAILASGGVGIVVTWLYAFFQTRVSFPALARATLFVMAVLVIGTWYGINHVENSDQVVYLAFVFSIPFSSLSLLVFWGTFGRLFDLRQSKRIIGGIDSGQLLASILALFGVGFVLNQGFATNSDLYFFSGLSALFLFGVFLIVSARFKLVPQSTEGEKVDTKAFSFAKIVRHRYIGVMAIFVIVSIIAVSFVDYSFLNVITVQFETETELGAFIALFEATVVFFSFLFQTFVTDWVIENYGLRISLLINPFLIGIFTGIALVIGLLVGFAPGEDFIYFFLIIAMSKLFIDSIKDALDGPTFKLYFLPVSSDVKFDVQTKVEGVITNFGLVFAGAMIILINNLQLELIFITIALVPVILGWYLITTRMHDRYKDSLQDSLTSNKETAGATAKQTIAESLEGDISDTTEEGVVLNSLRLLEKIEPGKFEDSVEKFSRSSLRRVKQYATQKADSLELGKAKETEIRKLAAKAVGGAESSDVIALTPDQVYNLGKSLNRSDRLLAAKVLRSSVDDQNIFVLIDLLRDLDTEVRTAAITTARKTKRSETWSNLIDLLDSTVFGNQAASALVAMGDDVLTTLENAFHKSGQTLRTQLMIVRIMGRIGGENAFDLLWNKMDFPDRKVVRQILQAFERHKFQAMMHQQGKLIELLEAEIGKAIWNMAATLEIDENDDTTELIESLNEEIKSNFEFIYMLLGILYDQESVELVRGNIETGTTEGIAYAIELMDIFVAKDLKPKLFPLLDDKKISDKLATLQAFYPRETYEEKQTLNNLLNRDYHNTNRWTKVCAMYALSKLKDFKVKRGLVAQIFNPDPLLQETAAWIIYNKDKKLYRAVSYRLPEENRVKLEELLSGPAYITEVEDPYPMRLNKTRMLTKIPAFEGLAAVHISQMVDRMEIRKIAVGETFDLKSSGMSQPIIINATGSVTLHSNGSAVTMSENQVFGDIFLGDKSMEIERIEANNNSVLYLLDINDLLMVLSNFPEQIQEFVNKTSVTITKEFAIK